MALVAALHVGEVQEVHEFVREALPCVARDEPALAVEVHAADLGPVEVPRGVLGAHDGDEGRFLRGLLEVRVEEVPLEALEHVAHALVR